MRIKNLSLDRKEYTSNVYYITGTWNKPDDVNTLIDVGRDKNVIKKISEDNSTGIGKKKVEQVLITHSHYDHTEILPDIKNIFNPTVYAYSKSLDNVDKIIKNGDRIKVGDQLFEAIHTPGHSRDSFCFYCEKESMLFSGDTPLIIHIPGGSYELSFLESLERLSLMKISIIYPGHGKPVIGDCNKKILHTLKVVRESEIIM